jgi:hypothetical protein
MSNLDKFNTANFKAQFHTEGEYTGSGDMGGSYEYIAKLLLNPVSDGRNRLLWLVLAPYAVSILKLDREKAIDLVTEYIKACHELKPCQDVIDKVEQYVDNAANVENGLKPPHLDTLQQSDPELYEIVQEAIRE